MARYTHRPVVYRLGELLLGTPRVRSRKNSKAKSLDGSLASPLGVADGVAGAVPAAGPAAAETTLAVTETATPTAPTTAASGEKGGEAELPPSPIVDTTDVLTTKWQFAAEESTDVRAAPSAEPVEAAEPAEVPAAPAEVAAEPEAPPPEQRTSAVHRSYFDLLEEKYEPGARRTGAHQTGAHQTGAHQTGAHQTGARPPAREARSPSIFGGRSPRPAGTATPEPRSRPGESRPAANAAAAFAGSPAPVAAPGTEAVPFQGKHLPKEVVDRQVASSQRRDRRRRWLYPSLAALTMSAGIYASFRLNAPGSGAPAETPAAGVAAPPSAASSVEKLIGRSTEPEHVRVTVPRDSAAPSRSVDAPPKARTASPKSPPKAAPPTRNPGADARAEDAKAVSSKAVSSKAVSSKAVDANSASRPRNSPRTEPAARIEIVPDAPIVAPVRKFSPQPDYPADARSAGLEGSVMLYGLIGTDGTVRDARVLRGLSPALDQAALAAFSTWRYEPARQGGAPIEQKLNVAIQFRLDAFTPTPRAPLPLEVGGDVSPPTRITMVWPTTPQSAQLVHGEVVLQLVVDEIGNVTSVNVLKGLPQGLTEAAIEAVRQWKFRPARRDGLPVAVFHQVSLRF